MGRRDRSRAHVLVTLGSRSLGEPDVVSPRRPFEELFKALPTMPSRIKVANLADGPSSPITFPGVARLSRSRVAMGTALPALFVSGC